MSDSKNKIENNTSSEENSSNKTDAESSVVVKKVDKTPWSTNISMVVLVVIVSLLMFSLLFVNNMYSSAENSKVDIKPLNSTDKASGINITSSSKSSSIGELSFDKPPFIKAEGEKRLHLLNSEIKKRTEHLLSLEKKIRSMEDLLKLRGGEILKKEEVLDSIKKENQRILKLNSASEINLSKLKNSEEHLERLISIKKNNLKLLNKSASDISISSDDVVVDSASDSKIATKLIDAPIKKPFYRRGGALYRGTAFKGVAP
jgi:hypothetical protein